MMIDSFMGASRLARHPSMVRALLKPRPMQLQQPTYYAAIQILVDGWPWNLSEFDFRRWFAPGSCPRRLDRTEISGEFWTQDNLSRLSGNRRVQPARRDRARERRQRVLALARAVTLGAA